MSGPRVLVVEDDQVNQLVLTRMLAVLGAQCDVVGDGLAALEVLARAEFDLVLLDLTMPGIGGLETVRRLRARECPRRVRVVALTGSATAQTQQACATAGTDGFLAKPVDLASLRATLDAADPSGAGPGHGRVLDDSRLQDLVAQIGDPTVVVETVDLFLAGLPAATLAIHDAVESAAGDLALRAHALRSSALTVGAERLARCCGDVEAAAKRGDAGLAGLMLSQLEVAVTATRAALEAWRAGAS